MAFSKALTQLVMFDLDGTLIDTVPDISMALDKTMESMNFLPPGIQNCRGWVGNGSMRLIERALVAAHYPNELEAGVSLDSLIAKLDPKLRLKAQQLFFNHYDRCCEQQSQLYKGVRSSLEILSDAGVALACVTNKPGQFSARVLAGCDISHFFSFLVSGDTLAARKPDPIQLLHTMAHFGVSAEQSLMVGDSRNDIEAARAARVPVLCVDYGYNHGEKIDDSARPASQNPDWVVGDLTSYFIGCSA